MKKNLWPKLAIKKNGDTKNFVAKTQLKLWQIFKYDKTETQIVTRPKQSKYTEKKLKNWNCDKNLTVPRKRKNLTKLKKTYILTLLKNISNEKKLFCLKN